MSAADEAYDRLHGVDGHAQSLACSACGCGVGGDGKCPCGCMEAIERTRETFALGAAWALGDDGGTLADLREQVAMLTTQRDVAERKHERLESGVAALAEEYEGAVNAHLREGHPDRESRLARQFVRDLRALLPGDVK